MTKKTGRQRVFKSKLTEKYDNLLLVTVEQNRPILMINLASLERQLVSTFVDKTIIIIQVAAILKEDADIFVEKDQMCPDH